ncbi:hypothetical protein [Ammonifex thiophilus]|uniref:Uncharacterized protein n=1 Tax=Ammonifex thiophilus TaxID=444093 RepID=A0A3D8P6I8_9THEO|nr:hypothetical protein [Ammonifex thiophilus]RDV84188.1 hypothetical protein DXX99_02425 [Ammonifex thiophilus]
MNGKQNGRKKPWGALLLWGALSLGLYAVVFLKGDAVQGFIAEGGVGKAAIVVAVAIIFSLVHGNFTGAFFEALGIRAKGR